MIGSLPKPKRNANYGKQPRANPLLRAWRMARRKRVAYARAQVADAMKSLQRQIARYEHLARVYDVPVASVGPLPKIPEMPGKLWVEHLQNMGELKPPVRPVPAAEPQAAGATS